jgi:hypothetical protein
MAGGAVVGVLVVGGQGGGGGRSVMELKVQNALDSGENGAYEG